MDGVHIANWSKSKRFNASMFASFVVAFVSSTAVAHYASDTSHHVNATAAVATDYAAYFGMYAEPQTFQNMLHSQLPLRQWRLHDEMYQRHNGLRQ